MLHSLQEIIGYGIRASDGELGEVADLYFDDQSFAVRYFVVETGGWLSGRKVLISPVEAGEPDPDAEVLPVDLTREQVEDSPDIDADLPVSRRAEQNLTTYYRWPPSWTPVGSGGIVGLKVPPAYGEPEEPEAVIGEEGDTHLRSFREVRGYSVRATDRSAGEVEDMLTRTREWVIRYLVVDTGNWLSSRRILVSPAWVTAMHWSAGEVEVDLPAAAIETSPELDPDTPISREYEKRLHDHYDRPKYWEA